MPSAQTTISGDGVTANTGASGSQAPDTFGTNQLVAAGTTGLGVLWWTVLVLVLIVAALAWLGYRTYSAEDISTY
jgi:hypothetical protein